MATSTKREDPGSSIPLLEKRIKALENGILNRVYPVGCYFYTSSAKYNPERMGGKWTKETNSSPYRWKRVR